MKWTVLLICLLVSSWGFSLSPVSDTHENQEKIDKELRNVFGGVQPLQFDVRSATPSYQDLQDGQMIVYASNTWVALHLRIGTTNYQVRFSTI